MSKTRLMPLLPAHCGANILRRWGESNVEALSGSAAKTDGVLTWRAFDVQEYCPCGSQCSNTQFSKRQYANIEQVRMFPAPGPSGTTAIRQLGYSG